NNMEVIFVNDGSYDNTLRVLQEQLGIRPYKQRRRVSAKDTINILQSGRYPHIYVINKMNSGKAASLNTGILYSQKELIVTLDCDCILEPNALKVMNQTFQDDNVIASGGIVHVMQYFLLNKKKRIIALQALDFIKGFLIYKCSLAFNEALNIISGAFGVFRKDALFEVGGFNNGLGEDIDITIRLQEYALKNNKKITYNVNAICYTECPETLSDLVKQRVRWHKAFLDALINNRRFLFKNFFKSSVCFLMVTDATFSGTIAVISFIFNIFLIILRSIFGLPLLFILITLLAFIFNMLNSLIAIKRAKKMGENLLEDNSIYRSVCSRSNIKDLLFSMIADLFFFSFLRIFFFIKGTISYSLNQKGWDKVKRSSNFYEV
ncbi:MAG: glycosyltransferase, partial [Christensenellales bacterium]